VIGAGPSGCGVLMAFKNLPEEEFKNYKIDAFECQAEFGGMWNYTWKTGVDAKGNAVHGSMYQGLWTNVPKEIIELPGYSFEEHYGKQMQSYLPRHVVTDYLQGRYAKADINSMVKFSTRVMDVQYDESSEIFTVTAKNVLTDESSVGEYDYVFVCTSHFTQPKLPEFEGFDTFEGRVLHSHDFRNASDFKNQDVLVIGGNLSAEDIASQIVKYGAKSATISYRSAAMEGGFPENITWVPLLQKIDKENVAHFKDGSSKKVDAVIICTGYEHHFPFLPEQYTIESGNRYITNNLYKGIFHEKCPKLMFLGMMNLFLAFVIFEIQAHYCRDVIRGKLEDPKTVSVEDRMKDIASQKKLEDDLRKAGDVKGLAYLQADYITDLQKQSDYSQLSMHERMDMFMRVIEIKTANRMTFRDSKFVSQVTGKEALDVKKPWLENFDATVNMA